MNSYEMAHNPELLIVGNPKGKKRRLKMRVRRRIRKGGPRRIRYGKKMYYYIQLVSKFGKGRARKIWGRKSKKSCGTRRRRSHGRKALPAPRVSYNSLVKRHGVKVAAKMWKRRR